MSAPSDTPPAAAAPAPDAAPSGGPSDPAKKKPAVVICIGKRIPPRLNSSVMSLESVEEPV